MCFVWHGEIPILEYNSFRSNKCWLFDEYAPLTFSFIYWLYRFINREYILNSIENAILWSKSDHISQWCALNCRFNTFAITIMNAKADDNKVACISLWISIYRFRMAQQTTAHLQFYSLQFGIFDFGINWKFVFLIFINKSSMIHIWQLSWLNYRKFTFARIKRNQFKDFWSISTDLFRWNLNSEIACSNSNCTYLSSEFRLACTNKKKIKWN